MSTAPKGIFSQTTCILPKNLHFSQWLEFQKRISILHSQCKWFMLTRMELVKLHWLSTKPYY